MNVEIIEQAAIRAHAVAHEGAVAAIPETWARLWRWHEQAGLADSPLYPIGVCYEDPEAECGFRYYAGLVLPDNVEGAGGLRILDIPGGRYASYRHVGPYSDIAGAFRNLYGAWLPSSGHEPDDRPVLEIYRNTPCDTPVERLATDLLVPVRQRRR